MKYKVLLTGKNDSAIDDFFMQMSDNFEVLTTSLRYADITRHMTYFKPDIFVYCLYNETRDDLTQIANLKLRMSQGNTPLVVIGLKDDCDEFLQIANTAPDLILHRPVSVATIQEKIISLVKDNRFRKVLDERSEERAAAERESASSSSSGSKDSGSRRNISIDRKSIDKLMEQLASPDGGTGPLPDIPGKRKHILVVDDNAMMLKMLKEHLHNDYDVATAASGRVALKFLERKTTDLILLDYEMPEESGPDVLEQLRASEHTKDIPVIFLTGVTDTKKIKEALALKPQSYLLKPVDREKLLDTITKTIG
ncbi:MAG: response regulator [Lachnospiraceae bacterium]|nr:response regulator [Lachnospiraceae bacterium]